MQTNHAPKSGELDQPPSEVDESKLAWLRAATQEAVDSLDRGEGIILKDTEDIDAFVDGIFAKVTPRGK